MESKCRTSYGDVYRNSLRTPLLVFVRQLWNNVYYGYDYEKKGNGNLLHGGNSKICI